MSTCPSNDIHSVYLDNELPETYVAPYEAHIKSCPKCAAKLASLRAASAAFRTDAKAMTMDEAALGKSWERLQARLSYSKTTQRVYRFPAHDFGGSSGGGFRAYHTASRAPLAGCGADRSDQSDFTERQRRTCKKQCRHQRQYRTAARLYAVPSC